MNQTIRRLHSSFLRSLNNLTSLSDIRVLRKKTRLLMKAVDRRTRPARSRTIPTGIEVSKSFLLGELEQIQRSQTLERAHYYLARLHKALTSVKTAKANDLNLRRWKQYTEVLTDSLWILPKRDSSGNHSAWYWGNFVPQIPYQLMTRYTKKGEWVLDPFAGSGTTLLECQRLQRNGLGIELNPSVARKTQSVLERANPSGRVRTEIEIGDSTKSNFRNLLKKRGVHSVQLAILHPPYHDIIRFSKNRRDLSNASSVDRFTELFGLVVDHVLEVLDKNRFFAVVIGDKYDRKEWIPLGFRLMDEVLKRDCRLKSIVVKNFEQTAGKRKLQALWRYRAMAGGFYVFKHEYIFIFQKK